MLFRSLRQSGFLAAAGLVSLKEMTERLKEDHENAIYLGEELSKIRGVHVMLDDIHINMVFFDMKDTGFSTERLVKEFENKGIIINPEEEGLMRFVTNYWVGREDVDYVVQSFKEVLGL